MKESKNPKSGTKSPRNGIAGDNLPSTKQSTSAQMNADANKRHGPAAKTAKY